VTLNLPKKMSSVRSKPAIQLRCQIIASRQKLPRKSQRLTTPL